MDSVFIFAHACRLNTRFVLGNKVLYFKSEENTCAVSDATQIDLDASNFPYEVNQHGGPSSAPYDYSLSFYDPMQDFGLNSFGMFLPWGQRLADNPPGDVLLSALINAINAQTGITKFYLNICRTPCPTGGKNKNKNKNKIRKSKRKLTNKRKTRKSKK